MIKPSKETLITTIIMILLLIYFFYITLVNNIIYVRITFTVVALIMVYIFVFRMPIKVKSNPKEIKIIHLIGSKVFLKDDFEIVNVKYTDLGYVFRLFGSGGFCGHIGFFKSRKIGCFYGMYLNKRSIILLISKKTGKKYIIDNPDYV